MTRKAVQSPEIPEETIEILDPVAFSIQERVHNILQSRYVGAKNTADMRSMVDGSTRAILVGMVQAGEIEGYKNVVVSTAPSEPKTIQIKFEILPVKAIDYILITISLVPTQRPL